MPRTPLLSPAKSMSIVWGITLAFLTLMDWNTLNTDPVSEDILTPFISRHITVTTAPHTGLPASDLPHIPESNGDQARALQYEVTLEFNSLLFLICFFAPPLAFYGLAQLARQRSR